MRESSVKTELVVAMTLAETFLLLLFVVWFATAKESEDRRPEMWKLLAEERRQALDQATKERDELKQKAEEFNKLVEWWRENFDAEVPRSTEELRAQLQGTPAGKTFLADLARGYPRCEENNVLVEAWVRGGRVRMAVVGESRKLDKWAAAAGVALPAVRREMRDWEGIRRYLTGVREFYRWEEQNAKPCRFDYRMTYQTKADYYDARETFERAFYAAGISREASSRRSTNE